jgi:hypothetical protein
VALTPKSWTFEFYKFKKMLANKKMVKGMHHKASFDSNEEWL